MGKLDDTLENIDEIYKSSQAASSDGGEPDEGKGKGGGEPDPKPEARGDREPEVTPKGDKGEPKSDPKDAKPEPKAGDEPDPKPEARGDREPEVPEGFIPRTELEEKEKEWESVMSDPVLKELIELKKSGKAITKELLREGFENYNEVKLDSPHISRSWVKKALIEEGFTDRQAELKLKKEYPLVSTPDDELDESELEDKEYQALQLQKSAESFIKQKKENQLNLKDIDGASTNKDDIDKAIQTRLQENAEKEQETLKNIATNVTDKVTKVDYEVAYKTSGGEEVKLPYSVEITGEMKRELRKELQNPAFFQAAYYGVNPKDTPEKQISEIMSRAVMVKYPHLINQLSASKAASKTEESFLDSKLTHRKQPPQSGHGSHVRATENPDTNTGRILNKVAEIAANQT